jgi:hypothetical protein
MNTPQYNSPEYWQAVASGAISWEQAEFDQCTSAKKRKRAQDSKENVAPLPSRHLRPAPLKTKQYSQKMSTQAARDDRLTPQSKALLQIIIARAGKNGRVTDTTKFTLGKMLSRSPRSIQRYLCELVKFGYLRTQIVKSQRTGLYIALRIWIMNSCLPYYARKNHYYEPSNWPEGLNNYQNRRNPEKTKLSPINDSSSIIRIVSEKKPPWYMIFALR